MRRLLVRALPVVALSLTFAVGGAAPASASHDIDFLATVMTGAQEAPGPGDPDGIGVFAAAVKGDVLCYVITARRIETPTAAHIHVAPPGSPGPIVVGLRPPVGGFASDCISTVPDDQNTLDTLSESELAAILANPGGYYVNLHNDPFRAGAIRGQLHG